MMKRISLCLLLLVIFVPLGAKVYEYDITISDPVFSQRSGHFQVDIPGCMQIGIEGEPLRPHVSFAYALPLGETLETIELIVDDEQAYPMMLPLVPKQPDRPLSWGNSDQGFLKKETVYALSEYPGKKINAHVQWYRGVAVVMGMIDPTRYYPASASLEIARSLKVRIRTTSQSTETRLSVRDKHLLEDIVGNPEILSSYTFAENLGEKMLIITTNQLKSEFDTLATHYLEYGIQTQIITTEDIQLGDVPGRDIQEKVRTKIHEQYLLYGLDYVLIGGNSLHVPHRGLSCQVYSGGVWVTSDDIPADLYYAALDGDWDRNANGQFGEYLVDTGFDEADLLPELAIGRMPAATREELENMIAKSIRYQREPIVDELNKQVFFGEFLYPNPESWASDYMELLIGRRTDNGYETQGIPSVIEITKWYDQSSTDEWDKETVKEQLAMGTSFVHHDGHCNYTSMMKFSTADIHDSDFVTVNGIDHTLPVLYSHGCNCGGFDHYNCIGTRLVTSPYITVGAVLNSRYGWFNEGQTEGPSIHLHREFEHAIYGMSVDHFGWALSISKLRTASWVTAPNQHEQNALRWNYYAQNLLGDPAMRIYSDIPLTAEIYYDLDQLEEGVIEATASGNSDPVENAGLAVLDSLGELLGYARTNENGRVVVDLSREIEPGEKIRCIVSGYNVVLKDSAFTVVESAILQPEDHCLLNNYPNPFNPATTFEYSIPYNMDVKIALFDVTGRLVRELVNEYREAGVHRVLFNAGDLTSGTYICRLQTETFTVNKKILLLK